MESSSSDHQDPSLTQQSPRSSDGNPYAQARRKVRPLRLIVIAVVAVIIVVTIIIATYWTPGVSLTGYTAELNDDGYVVFNVHLKNDGSARSVTVYCSFTIGNNSFSAPLKDQKAVIEVNAGQQLETNVSFNAGSWANIDPLDPPELTHYYCELIKSPMPTYSLSGSAW